MIPYEVDKINSLLDVKAEYPNMFNTNDLNDRRVKIFAKTELKAYIQEAFDKYEFDTVIGLKPIKPIESQLKSNYIGIAYARALYRYYWCQYNVLDQICKYGFKNKDVKLIMQRMARTKYSPWNTTEPTAGQFLESKKNYSCKRIKTKDGDEHFVHNAKGYGEDEDDSEDVRKDRDDRYYF